MQMLANISEVKSAKKAPEGVSCVHGCVAADQPTDTYIIWSGATFC